MKKKDRNIIYAWVLLLFFTAGQYMVFAHQHYKQGNSISVYKAGARQVLKEKCDICDVMHHTPMLLSQQVYFAPAVVVLCHYQFKQTDATPIQLVLAAGRAPPVA